MSTSTKGETTRIASSDFTAKQFFIGAIDAAGAVALAASATALIIGVVQNLPVVGEAANVRTMGTTKVKLGGTVTAGAWITSDAAGKGIATVTVGNIVIGRALAAGVNNDIIEVQLGVFVL